ncbi:replication-relaxation family protein [Longispora urticae]
MSRVPPPPSKPQPLDVLRRVTGRDLQILDCLAEHHLLSTGQIAATFFDTVRSAQQRLTILHRTNVLSRHTWSRPRGGNGQFLYSLGPIGARLRSSPYELDYPRRPFPRSHAERVTRLVSSQKLRHAVGVNQFFIDLISHTHTHRGTHLERWWSEHHATSVHSATGIRPDAHGIWTAQGRTVGFWLEHDNGTESHRRILSKFAPYRRLLHRGPHYPVLLWVPSDARRDNLLASLRRGVGVPVAVAAHGHDPATRIWHLAGTTSVLALHELPSAHGPNSATNPGRYHEDP